MVVVRRRVQSAVTLICCPIMVDDPASAAADAREARDRGSDLVEFRIDGWYSGSDDLDQIPQLVRLLTDSPLPCIVTCRPVLEGGQYDGDDQARISMFERLCAATSAGEHAPTYIDVELATYTRSQNIKQKVNLAVDHPGQLRSVTTGLILSMHDFQSRPPDLFRSISLMTTEPACRVSKVAYRARSLRDNLELLDILLEAKAAGKPMIALGMGQFGMMSRVLSPKFDGFLTFASLRRSSATAPGQPTIDELLQLYRFRSIGPATRVYGVIGWPIEHSLSPLVHNAGFEAAGHDGVYLYLPIAAEYEHFKATVLSFVDHVGLDFCGASVTIPHKENLVRLARESYDEGDGRWSWDELSAVCGAANTLHITRDAKGRAVKIRAVNTDGPAAVGALRDALGGELRTVVILGAGGTARALAAALVQAGVRVRIANRTPERAVTLVTDLQSTLRVDDDRLSTVEYASLAAIGPDAVFNTTSVGMSTGPAPHDVPMPIEVLHALPRHTVVGESVYTPRITPFLQAAIEHPAGAMQTIDGSRLFVEQAAAQFELWTGGQAPRGLFARIASESAT